MAFEGKIYYLPRTWPQALRDRSCAPLRVIYAEALKRIGEVVVVTPGYGEKQPIVKTELIALPVNKTVLRFYRKAEEIGIVEDYLERWVQQSVRFLQDRITAEDVVFATTGGELGCIKIGALLKQKTGCRLIVNFHDPIDGEVINGEKLLGYKGRSRQEAVMRYLLQADGMIASCQTYAEHLSRSYPEKKDRIYSCLFGYLQKVQPSTKTHAGNPLSIVYAGATSAVQNVEVLYKALKGNKDVRLIFICADAKERKAQMPEENVLCLPLMEHDKFLQFMREEADVGFVSLHGDYAGNCVPSKLYEYINLGLPILACLPNGQAKDIIRRKGYGIAADDDDVDGIRAGVQRMLDPQEYKYFVERVREDHEFWACSHQTKTFYEVIQQLLT